MKKRLIQNLSVNTIQLIINQLLGLGIFYVLSTGLDKNSFGQINLSLAILLAVFNILSFGIDQLVIKKIAAGANIRSLLSIYFFHVIITGFVFYGLLFLGSALFPHTDRLYNILLLIGIGKLMIFFSTPFKQAANGMERFKLLAYMSVFLFTRSSGEMTRQKIQRNKVYRVCGIVMAVSVLGIPFDEHPAIAFLKPTLLLETIALVAFGTSWLTKGELILKDKPQG